MIPLVVQQGLTCLRPCNMIGATAVSLPPDRLSQHMPLRQEVQFLRYRARRLREMAEAHRTPLSDQLKVMAAEIDALADRTGREEPGGPAE
jgi:hypothetical protein